MVEFNATGLLLLLEKSIIYVEICQSEELCGQITIAAISTRVNCTSHQKVTNIALKKAKKCIQGSGRHFEHYYK